MNLDQNQRYTGRIKSGSPSGDFCFRQAEDPSITVDLKGSKSDFITESTFQSLNCQKLGGKEVTFLIRKGNSNGFYKAIEIRLQ